MDDAIEWDAWDELEAELVADRVITQVRRRRAALAALLGVLALGAVAVSAVAVRAGADPDEVS